MHKPAKAKGKPYRRSLANNYVLSNRNDGTRIPFPISSVSTILLVVLVVSTLSALYIGAARDHHVALIGIPIITAPIADTAGSAIDEDGKNNNLVLSNNIDEGNNVNGPSIHSLQDLKPSELHPKAGPNRHIVSPPPDEIPVTLVTCTTTVGYLHILVHPSWAPLGAERFLQMVNSKYFSSKVALMRCIKGFLCQFGIPGDPSFSEPYDGKILKDDPNWLPEGPTYRTNELGVKRFGKGYLAYAGGGKNTRGTQLIVALKDNERLGGGSPWEVPWGEVVGEESFDTLDTIYTGYGDNGPSQYRLRKLGSTEAIEKDFPNLDYVLSCEVVDSR